MAKVDPSFSALCNTSWLGRERILAQFESDWYEGERPSIEEYLRNDVSVPSLLIELVSIELEFRARRGEPIDASEYLRRFPVLAESEEQVRELLDAVDSLRTDSRRTRGPRTQPTTTAPGGEVRYRLDRYELLEQVGQGSFSVVYRALDTQLDRVVAVKLPRSGCWSDLEARTRFLREARSLARLNHPGIVAVHDAAEREGSFVIVSEFITGETLAERLLRGRPTAREATELLASVCDAIAAAHQAGVIHRDLKPANIMIDGDGRPRVMDFGLARSSADETALTVEGQVLGTPAYMPPEQASGNHHGVDERSDIYSLGVVLFQLLTGHLPFPGHGYQLIAQILENDPAPPHRFDSTVPVDLETICLKAIAKEPGRRYRSSAELADDLRRFLRGEPVHARPVGPMARLWRTCRRRPFAAATLGTLALMAIASFGVVTWEWRRAERFRAQAEANLVVSEQQRLRLLAVLKSGHQALSHSLMIEKNRLQYGRDAISPDSWWVDRLLGNCSALIEQLKKEPALKPELAEILLHKGDLEFSADHCDLAVASWESARTLLENLVAERGDDPWWRRNLGHCYQVMGQIQEDKGQPAEAARLYRQSERHRLRSFVLCEQKLRSHPGDFDVQYMMARASTGLGTIQIKLGRPSKARSILERALTDWERLLKLDFSNAAVRGALDYCCRQLIEVTAALHRSAPSAEARNERVAILRALDECLRIQADLQSRSPADLTSLNMLGVCSYWKGAIETDLGRSEEALLSFQHAAARFSRLSEIEPTRPAHRSSLAASLHYVSTRLSALDRHPEAVVTLRRERELRDTLRNEQTSNTRSKGGRASNWHQRGVDFPTRATGNPNTCPGHSYAVGKRLAGEEL